MSICLHHLGQVHHSHFSAMESPTKPWYLSTKAIFRVVRKATIALSTNKTEFDQSLFGINALAKLIKSKTENEVLVLDLEKAQELNDKLDQIRADQFVAVNDGLDDLRGQLSVTLRDLIARVTEQQRLATGFLSQKSAEAQSIDSRTVGTAVTVHTDTATWWSIPQRLAHNVLFVLQTQFPETYERASSVVEAGRERAVTTIDSWQGYCCGALHNADVRVAVTTSHLLDSARPYVSSLAERSAPAVSALRQRSQPYVDRARPMLDPLLARIEQVQRELAQHPTFGKYVSLVMERAQLLLQLTQAYLLGAAPSMRAALGLEGDAVLEGAEEQEDGEVSKEGEESEDELETKQTGLPAGDQFEPTGKKGRDGDRGPWLRPPRPGGTAPSGAGRKKEEMPTPAAPPPSPASPARDSAGGRGRSDSDQATAQTGVGKFPGSTERRNKRST